MESPGLDFERLRFHPRLGIGHNDVAAGADARRPEQVLARQAEPEALDALINVLALAGVEAAPQRLAPRLLLGPDHNLTREFPRQPLPHVSGLDAMRRVERVTDAAAVADLVPERVARLAVAVVGDRQHEVPRGSHRQQGLRRQVAQAGAVLLRQLAVPRPFTVQAVTVGTPQLNQLLIVLVGSPVLLAVQLRNVLQSGLLPCRLRVGQPVGHVQRVTELQLALVLLEVGVIGVEFAELGVLGEVRNVCRCV